MAEAAEHISTQAHAEATSRFMEVTSEVDKMTPYGRQRLKQLAVEMATRGERDLAMSAIDIIAEGPIYVYAQAEIAIALDDRELLQTAYENIDLIKPSLHARTLHDFAHIVAKFDPELAETAAQRIAPQSKLRPLALVDVALQTDNYDLLEHGAACLADVTAQERSNTHSRIHNLIHDWARQPHLRNTLRAWKLPGLGRVFLPQSLVEKPPAGVLPDAPAPGGEAPVDSVVDGDSLLTEIRHADSEIQRDLAAAFLAAAYDTGSVRLLETAQAIIAMVTDPNDRAFLETSLRYTEHRMATTYLID